MATSERECIGALWEAADRLGESPTKAQYEDLGLTPASATIIRVVGGWNEAKARAGLATNPSTGSRTKPKPDDVELPDGLEWEGLSVDQRWYYRHTERSNEWNLRRRAELRSWVNDRKRARGCAECEEDDPACLDLHHLDEETKERAVGKMITYGAGKERLEDEIRKCEVLCANCHRRRHYDGPFAPASNDGPDAAEEYDARRWVDEYKRGTDGCVRCAAKDPACLDFHHVGSKGSTVARLVSDDRPKDVIRSEIDRCEVLCANCHRKEHHEPPDPPTESDRI